MSLRLEVKTEAQSWPLAGTFAISRGAKTVADVLVVTVSDGEITGSGECVPYGRYGETMDSVQAQLEAVKHIECEADELDLLSARLAAGAARNAFDCALWDYRAKRSGQRVWSLAGLDTPQPVTSAFTLSLDSPEKMAEAAALNASRPLLKMKLAGDGDLERVAAVREQAPNAILIVDANEGWKPEQIEPMSLGLAELGVAMVEQPVHADEDHVLADLEHPLPFCADESCHTRDGLHALKTRYEFVNIKLDKTGGLTEALALREEARAAGFRIMVGCMMGTSLAMAPALLVAQGAEFVDLDGPLWMAKDRVPGLSFYGSVVSPPSPDVWG